MHEICWSCVKNDGDQHSLWEKEASGAPDQDFDGVNRVVSRC